MVEQKVNTTDKKVGNDKKIRLVIIIMAVVILLLSVCLVTVSKKSKSTMASGFNAENSLDAVENELSSYKAEASERQSVIESYSFAANEQSSAFSSEKDILNSKINELNKQISIKHSQQATTQPPQAPPEIIDGSMKTVYLTFDDGPSPNTLEILKILDENGVKATFFVINGKHNSLMKNIVDSGNTIGLHTYSHNYSEIYSSDEAYYNDLQAISDVVFNETGVRADIIRFPGGSSNTVSKKYCEGIMTRVSAGVMDKGYNYFDWNVTSGDANSNSFPKDSIINNCRNLPKSNTVIVLMHDSSEKNSTVEALPEVIAYYKSIGCSFGVLSNSTNSVHHKINN